MGSELVACLYPKPSFKEETQGVWELSSLSRSNLVQQSLEQVLLLLLEFSCVVAGRIAHGAPSKPHWVDTGLISTVLPLLGQYGCCNPVFSVAKLVALSLLLPVPA
jgi:hypothetical protein